MDGRDIYLFKLQSTSGSYVELSNYGATVVSVNVPDRNGKIDNVVLGFDSLQGYLQDKCYIGSTIGRFANRIGNAKFIMDGIEYFLEANDGLHTNHSASAGFNDKVFDYMEAGDDLIFEYLSADMSGGYPGNLTFQVKYVWSVNDELEILFTARTDRKTVVNFTNHCYFNLSGTAKNIFDHRLTVLASSLVEAAEDHIPTGRIVNALELSFTKSRIADRMTAACANTRGLNVCYVLEDGASNMQNPSAILSEPISGRELIIYTTYPGLMVYTGTYLESSFPGNHKINYRSFDGLCLECQRFPDSPNQPHFPSTVLLPDQVFQETIRYCFNTHK